MAAKDYYFLTIDLRVSLTSLLRLGRRHRLLWLLLAVIAGSWGLFLEVAHELREDRL